MSYQMPLNARKRKAARFVSKVHKEIQKAFTDAAHEGMTQRKLAAKLEIDKGALNRRLTGEANLTLRSIADLAWALDADIEFAMRRKPKDPSRNFHVLTSKAGTLNDQVAGVRPTFAAGAKTENLATGNQKWR